MQSFQAYYIFILIHSRTQCLGFYAQFLFILNSEHGRRNYLFYNDVFIFWKMTY